MIKRNSTKAFFALLLPISLLMSNPAFAEVGETPITSQETASKAGGIIAGGLELTIASVLLCTAGKSFAADVRDKQDGGWKAAFKNIFWTKIKATHPWNEESAISRFWAPGVGGALFAADGIRRILTAAGVIDPTDCAG